VTRFASLLDVEIRVVETDDSSEPTTPAACSEPTAQETPQGPTPTSEPEPATAVPPGEAAAASPEPTQPTGNRPRCPRDQKTGQCRYSDCNNTGVCGISKEPITSGVLARAAPRSITVAKDFLIRVQKDITTGAVRLVSFANAVREGLAKPVFTRDPQEVENRCRKWDWPGRSMFASMCTVATNQLRVTEHDLHE
jgi:hypothetical protein